MSHDLLVSGIPLAEKVLRTVCVYVFLLIGLRIAGKRELGQLNPFDLVVLLLLSNTVQNAIIGDDNSLVGGVVGAVALLALNWLVVRVLYTHPIMSRLLEGNPALLIEDGKVLQSRLKRELITHDELVAAARKQGIESLSDVDCCRLEVGGALTFEVKQPTVEEKRQRVLLVKLEELTAAHAELLTRLSVIERGLST